VSARQITDLYLDRIARATARSAPTSRSTPTVPVPVPTRSIRRFARGDDVGRLGGVPLAIKDVIVTEGLTTTAASKILDGWVPPYDATAVARLRAAGAIILGKLNCDEFAMGSSNERSGYRPCVNPWDPTRVPGGSSGGSAAAVAAGLAAATLGTIPAARSASRRRSAAWSGSSRPTAGVAVGAIAFASSLDQIGPLARTVEDAALLFETIAGLDPRDATSIDAPVPDSARRSSRGERAQGRAAARVLRGGDRSRGRGPRCGPPPMR